MKTLVCTLAIGEARIPHVNKLLQTFKQYTDYEVVVYTDRPSTSISTPTDRVIRVDDITSAPFKVQAAFNFNLKGIVTAHAYRNFLSYDRVIWADCDVYLTDKCPRLDEYIDGDVYFRIGPFPPPPSVAELKYQIIRKIMHTPNKRKELVYVNEVLFVINRNSRSTKFIIRWSDLCIFSSLNYGINPCYEAVEVAIALNDCDDLKIAEIPKYNFTPTKHPAATLFTEHRDKPFAYI